MKHVLVYKLCEPKSQRETLRHMTMGKGLTKISIMAVVSNCTPCGDRLCLRKFRKKFYK